MNARRIRKICVLVVMLMFATLALSPTVAATDYETYGDGYVGSGGQAYIYFDDTYDIIELLGANVSIGTSSTGAKLDVEKDTGGTYDSTTVASRFGDLDAQDNTYITGNTLNFAYGQNASSGGWINYRGYDGETTQFRDLYIGDGKGTAVAFFDGSSGNVGIGTTSPSSALQIAGSIDETPDSDGVHLGLWNNYAIMQLTGPSGGFIDFSGSTADDFDFRIVNVESSDDLEFRSDGIDNIMVLEGDTGDIGIGTNAPTYKLDVAGDGRYTGDLIVLGKTTQAGGVDPPYVSYSNESHESIKQFAQNITDHEKVMQFWNGDAHRMEIYVIDEDAFYTFDGKIIKEK